MKKLMFNAIVFLIGCFVSYDVNADLVTNTFTSPAYHFMPQNIYHNNTHNSSSDYNKPDNCKTTGTVKKILIKKSEKKMYLLDTANCIVKQYNVRLGINPGPKHCDGDKKTPEGIYKIIEKRDSKYVKFLALDYPRSKDIKKAKELGCKPGDSIGIHSWVEGLPVEGSLGCITVWTKHEILEINRLVRVNTTVEIVD
jgi:murein L,D-transpeptidase YafK